MPKKKLPVAIPMGIDFIKQAAQTHGEESDPEHQVGDLEDALQAAWNLMTPVQRLRLMTSPELQENLEMNSPEFDLDESNELLAKQYGLNIDDLPDESEEGDAPDTPAVNA